MTPTKRFRTRLVSVQRVVAFTRTDGKQLRVEVQQDDRDHQFLSCALWEPDGGGEWRPQRGFGLRHDEVEDFIRALQTGAAVMAAQRRRAT